MKKSSKKKPDPNPMRNPKAKKISSTQKLKDEIAKQTLRAGEWQERWEKTLEGQIERLRESVQEACDELEDSGSRGSFR